MNRFYLLVLNNHIILCLQNYHMNNYVDITAKRRRHHPSLHPSADVSPHMLDTFSGWRAGTDNQSLPSPHTLASNLVRWVEARAKLNALYAVFLGRGPLSFVLFR